MERIGIVGAGTMGAGIADVAARAGGDVVVIEVDESAVKAGRDRIEQSLERAVRRGKVEVPDAILDRIRVTTELDALADSELVIEAAPEARAIKTQVFRDLDRVVTRDDAILASNTSSIPIMQLAASTTRPEQVVGLHFFNPVPVLPLVELVRTLTTGDEVVTRAQDYLEDVLEKTVIHATDRAGFIVNALLIPYLLSAIRMYESGFATREDIDAGMVTGCAHPMGPLALSDLIGLDTLQAVAESLHREFRDPANVPPALLSRMVEAGLHGRKTGRGFYEYAEWSAIQP